MNKKSLTRRAFLELGAVAGGTFLLGGLAGCGEAPRNASSASSQQSASSASSAAQSSQTQAAGASSSSVSSQVASSASASASSSAAAQAGGSSLVLVFSRAHENYHVGYVETGNTMVLAQMIAQKTGADLFEIEPVTPYPEDYQSCLDVASEEKSANARPEVKVLPDIAGYDTIYFGFPCWWGDMPMPVYTVIEALPWTGKTIIPFNTHEGSGDAGMFRKLETLCAGATVLDGLTMTGQMAQNQRDEAASQVDAWLAA